MAFPTDARLYHKMRVVPVMQAARETRKLKTWLRRGVRDVWRKAPEPGTELERAERLLRW